MSSVPNWIGSDQSTRQRFQRATELTVSGAGGELLQTFINRTVQMLTLREFGLQSVLPRRPGQGNAEYINRRTAGTTGGEWVADTTSSGFDEVGAYAQVSFDYMTLLTRGKITRKLQATGRSYADVLGLEMAAKAEDFANQLERGIMSGNTFSTEANAPNGFLTLIQAVNAFDLSQVVSQTKDAVSLEKLDQTIDLVKGASSREELVIIGSFAGLRQVNAILQSTQRFNDITEIAAGFRVRTYDGIPMIISTQMSNTLEFGTGADLGVIKSNAGDETALMVLNTRYCYLSELTPTTVMPLAKASSQYDEFDMFWDGTPVLSNTFGAAMYTGITTG